MSTSITGLPLVTTLATSDMLGGDISGTTSRLSAGNLRKALFGFAAADPLNCGPLTATGASTITGTLGGITTLTCSTLVCSSITANVTGNVTGSSGSCTGNAATATLATTATAATTAGTVTTAAQPAITSLGTLTGLTTSGLITMTAAASRLVPGATSWSLRDTGNANDNLLVTDAGLISTRGAVAGASATAGSITLLGGVALRSTNTALSDSIALISGTGGGVDRVNLAPGGNDILWGTALVNLGGGAAPTLGTIGGSGPATAGQNKWMRLLDSAGAAMWIPVWK